MRDFKAENCRLDLTEIFRKPILFSFRFPSKGFSSVFLQWDFVGPRMRSIGSGWRPGEFYRVRLSRHHDGQRDVCLHCAGTGAAGSFRYKKLVVHILGEIGGYIYTLRMYEVASRRGIFEYICMLTHKRLPYACMTRPQRLSFQSEISNLILPHFRSEIPRALLVCRDPTCLTRLPDTEYSAKRADQNACGR